MIKFLDVLNKSVAFIVMLVQNNVGDDNLCATLNKPYLVFARDSRMASIKTIFLRPPQKF